MIASNKFYNFNTEDVLDCTSLVDLYKYKIDNLETITSIKIQLIEFGDDKSKMKALLHLEYLQSIIETQIDFIKNVYSNE
jgi:hypothetical protein